MSDSGSYEIVIEPSQTWLTLRFREFWEYRDLFVLLVQRDITARFKQTVLGPLWYILQPILTTAVFAVVFSRIGRVPTDELPAPLFYLCGLIGWNYFAQNITSGGSCFVTNAPLFGKVWFPRLIVPAAAVTSNLLALALQFIPFTAFFVFYQTSGALHGVHPNGALLLLPAVVIFIALLSFGVALCLSAATAKYRDLIHLHQYLVQVWMFATPIVYPLSAVPAKWKWIIWINPMSVPIEAFRICLLGRGTLGAKEIVIACGEMLALLFAGVALFQRVERTVVDSV